jgi:hypothetical protein
MSPDPQFGHGFRWLEHIFVTMKVRVIYVWMIFPRRRSGLEPWLATGFQSGPGAVQSPGLNTQHAPRQNRSF